MKFELIKSSISIVLLIVTSFINIYAVIVVLLLMSVLSNAMNLYQNKKLLGIKYTQQIKCIIPSFLCAAVMWVAVMAVGFVKMNVYLSLFAQIITGVIVYLVLSVITKSEPFGVLIKTIKEKAR